MVVYSFVKALLEFAPIIIIIVPGNARFQRFEALHRQENGPVIGNQKDAVHPKAGTRQVDDGNPLLASTFFAYFSRDADRITLKLA